MAWYTLYTNIKNYKTLSNFSCFFLTFLRTFQKLYSLKTMVMCVCLYYSWNKKIVFACKNKPVKIMFFVYHIFCILCCCRHHNTMLIVCLYNFSTKMCVSNKECITCDSHFFFMMLIIQSNSDASFDASLLHNLLFKW